MLIQPDALGLDVPLAGYTWIDLEEIVAASPGAMMQTGGVGRHARQELIQELTGFSYPPDAALAEKGSGETQLIFPAKISNLFVQFARLEPLRENIIEFSSRFGRLGVMSPEGYETLSAWISEILSFGRAYRLWVAIKQNDKKALEEVLDESHTVIIPIYRGSMIDKTPGNLHVIALHEIETHLNLAFAEHPFYGEAYLNTDSANLDLAFRPKNLISLIWIQFSQVVTNPDRWKICEFCGDPFKPESMKRRYCNDSHKTRAYQKRKEVTK